MFGSFQVRNYFLKSKDRFGSTNRIKFRILFDSTLLDKILIKLTFRNFYEEEVVVDENLRRMVNSFDMSKIYGS